MPGTCRSGTSIDDFRANTGEVTVGITSDTTLRGDRATHKWGDGARETGGPHSQGADGTYIRANAPTESSGSMGETVADAAGVTHKYALGYRANNVKVADGTTCATSL